MVILAGLLLIALGLLSIFAKDFMWDLTEWSNQTKGLASERTEWWDTTTTLGGVIAILVGVLGVVLGFR